MVLKKDVPVVVFSDVDVLEFTQRPYTNKKGDQVVYSSCLLSIDNKVFRVSVSKDFDLTPYVKKTCDITFGLSTWGDDLTPRISVLSAE